MRGPSFALVSGVVPRQDVQQQPQVVLPSRVAAVSTDASSLAPAARWQIIAWVLLLFFAVHSYWHSLMLQKSVDNFQLQSNKMVEEVAKLREVVARLGTSCPSVPPN